MQQQHQQNRANMAETLDVLVAEDGTGAHPYVLSGKLLADRNATRNLADAVHFLCVLHGRQPGVLDYAATKVPEKDASEWLIQAANAFSRERAYLSKLAVAVGPLPSTVGQANCEAALAAQRHAIDMLAQSDRRGCALGAAIALCLDWLTVRAVLNSAAERLEVKIPECTLPDVRDTAGLANGAAASVAVERAINFGAQQILGQHRALWDLLSAREESRRAF